jgi:hypothetical protein
MSREPTVLLLAMFAPAMKMLVGRLTAEERS